MPDTFGLYLRDIARTPLLSPEKEKHLFSLLQNPRASKSVQARARNQLLRANLRLVVKVARKYRGRGIPMEDLVGEGNLGLFRGIEGFNPSMGCRLSTYATWWIKQRIRRAVEMQSRTVRVPNHVLRLMVDWEEARTTLAGELGRDPNAGEIGQRLGLEPRCAEAVQKGLKAGAILTGGEREANEGAIPPETLPAPQGPEPLPFDEKDRLTEALCILRARDRTVITLRFGLQDGRPRTLDEVGETLGVTRERARQIEKRALGKLRKHLEKPCVCGRVDSE